MGSKTFQSIGQKDELAITKYFKIYTLVLVGYIYGEKGWGVGGIKLISLSPFLPDKHKAADGFT